MRYFFPLVLGLAGCAILVSLGIWQLQRLAWKEGVLATIAAKMAAPAVTVPLHPDPAADRYLPVAIAGGLTGEEALVLTSLPERGPGFRVIAVLATADGRRLLVDRGFLPEAARRTPRPPRQIRIAGNLHWPDEVDSYTPAPGQGLWYARDVPALAAALGTEPLLIVSRSETGDGITPLGVDTSGIPNNHLGYAVQWFGLAIVWAGMTLLYLWRIRHRQA